jgi:hypothetical protein
VPRGEMVVCVFAFGRLNDFDGCCVVMKSSRDVPGGLFPSWVAVADDPDARTSELPGVLVSPFRAGLGMPSSLSPGGRYSAGVDDGMSVLFTFADVDAFSAVDRAREFRQPI